MTTKKKPAFMVHDDMCHTFLALPDQQASLLIKGLSEYHLTGEPVEFGDPVLNAVYEGYVHRLEGERESYVRKCEQNAENGKKGGRPRKEKANG